MGNRTNSFLQSLPISLPQVSLWEWWGRKGFILGEGSVLEVWSYYLSPWGCLLFPKSGGRDSTGITRMHRGCLQEEGSQAHSPVKEAAERPRLSYRDGDTQDYRHWPRDFWKGWGEPAVSAELEVPWCSVFGEWAGWVYPVQCSMTHGGCSETLQVQKFGGQEKGESHLAAQVAPDPRHRNGAVQMKDGDGFSAKWECHHVASKAWPGRKKSEARDSCLPRTSSWPHKVESLAPHSSPRPPIARALVPRGRRRSIPSASPVQVISLWL